MAEYTPTTDEVREKYADDWDMDREEFDRWLKTVLRAAYWEGVNDQWKHRPFGNRLPETSSPYFFDVRLGVDSHGS